MRSQALTGWRFKGSTEPVHVRGSESHRRSGAASQKWASNPSAYGVSDLSGARAPTRRWVAVRTSTSSGRALRPSEAKKSTSRHPRAPMCSAAGALAGGTATKGVDGVHADVFEVK